MDGHIPRVRIAFYLMSALSCASCSFSAPPAPSPAPLAPFPSRAPPGPARPASSPARPPRSAVDAHVIRNPSAHLPIPRRATIVGFPPRIRDTGYGLLNGIGGEEPGYGLYSYAILVKHGDRSIEFLYDVFDAIDPVERLPTPHSRPNLLSVPSRTMELFGSGHSRASFAEHFYNYEMAKTLLDHICDPPAEEVKVLCEAGGLRGPYIFAYAQPASKLTPVPPPFLIIDLSDVHERAFPEIIDAFLAQVKRDDFSDRAKIDTLRLRLLSILLKAADWVPLVPKAMADIVHVTGGQSEKDKN